MAHDAQRRSWRNLLIRRTTVIAAVPVLVIGGLALSTPVTLLVIPGLYGAIKRRSS
jgi:hypothetical protein